MARRKLKRLTETSLMPPGKRYLATRSSWSRRDQTSRHHWYYCRRQNGKSPMTKGALYGGRQQELPMERSPVALASRIEPHADSAILDLTSSHLSPGGAPLSYVRRTHCNRPTKSFATGVKKALRSIAIRPSGSKASICEPRTDHIAILLRVQRGRVRGTVQ